MESYVRLWGRGLKNLTYPYMGVGGGSKIAKIMLTSLMNGPLVVYSDHDHSLSLSLRILCFRTQKAVVLLRIDSILNKVPVGVISTHSFEVFMGKDKNK